MQRTGRRVAYAEKGRGVRTGEFMRTGSFGSFHPVGEQKCEHLESRRTAARSGVAPDRRLAPGTSLFRGAPVARSLLFHRYENVEDSVVAPGNCAHSGLYLRPPVLEQSRTTRAMTVRSVLPNPPYSARTFHTTTAAADRSRGVCRVESPSAHDIAIGQENRCV